MADLSEIQASQSIKIAGAGPASGVEDNWADVDSNGNLLVKPTTAGPVTPGTVAANSNLVGGQFNSTAPTLTNGQQSAIQMDSNGRILVAMEQDEIISANNSSTANLASGATFTGSTTTLLDYAAWEINFKADQNVTIQAQQSTDNVNWDIADTYTVAANTGDSRIFAANTQYGRVLVTNNGGSTTTFLRLQTILTPVGNALPRALTQLGNLKVAIQEGGITNFPTTVDTNYGTVGASTLRVASQIGNATGAALFGAGTTTAQVLRVVLPTDQSAIPVTQSGAWTVAATQSGTWNTGRTWTLSTGTDSILAAQSGTWTVQPGNTANTTAWFVKDNSLGTVAAGTAGTQSSLAGGVFNTALPTLTNGQQAALQLDSSGRLIISSVASGLLTEDHNYGTVGASTLRTASQIGNATGSADFNAGNSSAQTLRVVIATNQAVLTIQGDSASGAAKAGNPVQIGGVFNTTQPTVTTGQTVEAQSTARGALIVSTGVDNFNINNISGTVSLPTGAATSANQSTEITSLQLIDNIVGSGPGAGAAGTGSALMGGVFNTALPTLATGQQAALQLDSSGRLIIAPLTSTSTTTAAEDHNYGTVGANTLRTASQVGNATGAADFNYGTVGAQTLRVASQIGNATGAANFNAGATGAQTLRVEANQGAAGSAAWLTTDAADGPVTPGAVASKSMLIGGQFNSTLPTLTNTQQSAIQLDSSGRVLVSGLTVDVAPATVNITARDIASTVTAGANSQSIITGAATASSTASFAFTSEDAISLQVTGAWTGTLQAEVSLDGGTTWYIRPLVQTGTVIVSGTFTGNFTAICNVSGYTNFRIRSTAAMTGTATVKVIESINPGAVYIANPLGISDSGGDQIAITPNNDLQVADIINTSSQYRAQSVTTTAGEALGAGTILASRKLLIVTPTNGTVYWGTSNAVTTSTGQPIFKNTPAVWTFGSNVHVWLICASGTVDCRITEGS